MADIVWGAAIPVAGKRPAWLPYGEWQYKTANHDLWQPAFDHFADIAHVRLAANSPIYTALEAGFMPWMGGDAAPADWDGGAVLYRCGDLSTAPHADRNWKVNQGRDRPNSYDIIGYKRKAEAVEHDGDYVRVKRMTEEEARSFYMGAPFGALLDAAGRSINMLRMLGLIREQTRAETISATTGVPIADVEKVLAEIAS